VTFHFIPAAEWRGCRDHRSGSGRGFAAKSSSTKRWSLDALGKHIG
jgi:hypothetical protein